MTAVQRQIRYRWTQWLPPLVFVIVFTAHAVYLSRIVATPMDGWARNEAMNTDFLGLETYLQSQDYYMGFSYALGAAFTAWAAGRFFGSRQAAMGAAGSVTFVGALMATGCFIVGCCGSPMLGVYLGIFGANALGVGKPLMALVSLFSVVGGYWYLSRQPRREICLDSSCACRSPSDKHGTNSQD